MAKHDRCVADQPLFLIASVGRFGIWQKGEAPDLPTNFLTRAHVPQGFILSHAQAVISSATTTAVLGALTHGVPLLLVPGKGGGEQLDLVDHCVREQVGICVERADVNADSLAHTIQQLLTDCTIQRNAKRMQTAFARYKGNRQAVDLLEKFGVEKIGERITE